MNAFRLIVSLFLVAFLAAVGVAAEKKRPKKAKGYDYENSKYKAYKELTGEPRTYRFDERGNPIPPAEPKKKKGKKKASSDEDERASGSEPKAESCDAAVESCEAPKE